MPCFRPVTAWYAAEKNASGKRRLVFTASGGFGLPLKIACGGCLGCRLERSRQWALRAVHEAQLHEANSFLTLTYAPEHLPADGCVNRRDVQLFLKRLRRALAPVRLRYLLCGEYGDKLSRPHYHVLLFGWDFLLDRRIYKRTEAGDLYSSPTLDAAWGLGLCTIGAFTFESAAYVARYCMKKVNGPLAESHYERVDADTGELCRVTPEFFAMSLKPGIGSEWFDRFATDVYPDDFCVQKGKKLAPPRFYDKRLPADQLADIKSARKARAGKFARHNTPRRLRDRETVKAAQIKTLKRNLHDL